MLVAEELDDAELAHLALERAAVGKGHVGMVIGEVCSGNGGGAISQDVVLDLEDLTDDFWG